MRRFHTDEVSVNDSMLTPEGFLKVPVTATRVGVFKYYTPDGGVRREARPAEEVFKKESLDSMRGIPVTNGHPYKEFVNSENAKSLSVGFTSDVVNIRDKYIDTFMTITDKASVEDVLKRGKVQVSMGYNVEKEKTAGQLDGEPYDLIQRNIRYNHIAIVDVGRAGPNVRIRLDSQDDELIEEEGDEMKIKIGDREYEMDEAAAKAVQAVIDSSAKIAAEKSKAEDELKELKSKSTDAADLSAKLAAKQKEIDALQAKFDQQQTEIDALKKGAEKKMDSQEVERVAREISRVDSVAKVVLDEKELDGVKGKPVSEIKKAVIKKVSPSVDVKRLDSVDYVDARFDAIAETALSSNADSIKNLGKKIIDADKDKVVDADASKTKQTTDAKDAWKTKLPASAE